MAIEDPFSTKRSLARSVSSPQVLDFISNCFRIAYLYFGTVQTTLGPILTKIIVPPREHKPKGNLKIIFNTLNCFVLNLRWIQFILSQVTTLLFLLIIAKKKEEKESDSSEVTSILNQLKLDDSVVVSSAIAPPVAAITLEELGMISHKKSLITIFGHKHKIKNFILKFEIFHEKKKKKISTAFEF